MVDDISIKQEIEQGYPILFQNQDIRKMLENGLT